MIFCNVPFDEYSVIIVGFGFLSKFTGLNPINLMIDGFSHKKVLPHLVVQSGQYKLITAVSKLCFTFDEKDENGNTSLFYAVISDDHKTMRKILKCR